MGHGSSKAKIRGESERLEGKKFRGQRRNFSSDHVRQKRVVSDGFAGIALFKIVGAQMKFRDRWLACVSLGEQTFRTHISEETDKPLWNSERKLLLEKDGARTARISVFETNRLRRNNLIGYCELDLLQFLLIEEVSNLVVELVDPSSSAISVGSVSLSCAVEDPVEVERSFSRRILSIVDYNDDGVLSFSEFSDFIEAFGNRLASEKKKELFRRADKNGDGAVSIDELAFLLTEDDPLLSCCPVCGETLDVSDWINSMIHLTLCFDEGTGSQVMTGGFFTETQASSHGWMFKLSEYVNFSSYAVGLKSGPSSSHILVVDRRTKRLVEELIDTKIVLSMRAIYQSKYGQRLMEKGVKELMQSLSEKQGRRMDSLESALDIPKFVDFFKDQINMSEVKLPIGAFKTFNEFFIRELKPGSRTIDSVDRDDVAVCAADSRLMAFKSVEDSLRFWIKGRRFSLKGLLGGRTIRSSSEFVDGVLVIFRLAPQDYHRFHLPVSGTIEEVVEIPGFLYTVNPIAVNSKYCNVFTENKRIVVVVRTEEFGRVAFVAIGATMVGSINLLKKEGDHVRKGEEFGYFSFGGSTVITVFEQDAIAIDQDLLDNSARSLETLVLVGMSLGVSTKRHAHSIHD